MSDKIKINADDLLSEEELEAKRKKYKNKKLLDITNTILTSTPEEFAERVKEACEYIVIMDDELCKTCNSEPECCKGCRESRESIRKKLLSGEY